MWKTKFIVVLICSSLYACKNSNPADPQKEQPAALQEKSVIEIGSKRGGENLVTNLYNELVEKSAELQALEKTIENLHDEKTDSLGLAQKYYDNNNLYYANAKSFTETITDSILQERIKVLINKSMSQFAGSNAKYIDIKQMLDTKEVTVNDLHLILKLTKTLPIMEKYQKDNVPSPKPLESIVGKFDKTIEQLNTLTKDKY